MYERLLDRGDKPTAEQFAAHIGAAKELFLSIDRFLLSELDAQKELKIDAHSGCWKIAYHRKRKYICDILSEKDSFTIVTRLTAEALKKVNDSVMPYAKACIENSPFFHRGWIEYRVLVPSHQRDAEMLLRAREGCL